MATAFQPAGTQSLLVQGAVSSQMQYFSPG